MNCSATTDVLTHVVEFTLEDGLIYFFLKVPSAIAWALSQVPRLVYGLNAGAFVATVLLAMLVTPIALITAVQCIWAIGTIGPARKTLSTTFLLLLWPLVVVLMVVVLAAIWAVLGLGVIAFIWLTPLGIVAASLWYGLSAAAAWRAEQQRIAARQENEVIDITFLELGLALLVASVSACTTAPLVAVAAVVKSPVVFTSVTLRCMFHVCEWLRVMVVNAGLWTILVVPPAFALALAGVLLAVAIGTACSVLIKLLGAVLWPGYVACGMLRSLGSRRQPRGCATILKQSCQAAYQVLWFSDIVTNATILMKFSLASQAIEQLMGVASGTRRELSAEVRSVSCLPPVVIGALRNDGTWRLDFEQLARTLHVDACVLEEVWTSFFQQMNAVGKTMIDRDLLTADYLSECPPALLIGLPALVVLAAIERSPQGKEELVLASGAYSKLTHATRPRGATFAEEAWRLLLEAKKAFEAAQPLPPQGYAALEAYMLAGGAPSDELPPLLAAAVDGGEAGLPPHLAAVHKPVYALVYKMAQQPAFKQQFNALVYDTLVEYSPAEGTAQSGRGYVPPTASGVARS